MFSQLAQFTHRHPACYAKDPASIVKRLRGAPGGTCKSRKTTSWTSKTVTKICTFFGRANFPSGQYTMMRLIQAWFFSPTGRLLHTAAMLVARSETWVIICMTCVKPIGVWCTNFKKSRNEGGPVARGALSLSFSLSFSLSICVERNTSFDLVLMGPPTESSANFDRAESWQPKLMCSCRSAESIVNVGVFFFIQRLN